MCETSDDCNNWGRCTAGVCDCIALFAGDNCSSYWLDLYPTWASLFWTYTAIGAVLNAIVLIWCFVAMARLIHATKFSKRTRKSLALQSFVLLAIASLLRFVYLLSDPHNSRRNASRYGIAIFYDLPIMFWFASGLSIFLYWIELQSRSRLTDLPNIKRFRPVLYILMAMTPLVLLPLTLWRQLVSSSAATIVYNVVIILMILTIVIMCLYSGRKLLSSIKRVMKTNDAPQYIIYLRSVTYFIISMMSSLLSLIVVLLIFSFVNNKEPWIFLGFHFVIRCLEFWLMMTMVLFLDKRRPKGSGHDSSKEKSLSDQQPLEDITSLPQDDNSLIKASEQEDVGNVTDIVIHSEAEIQMQAVGKESNADSND